MTVFIILQAEYKWKSCYEKCIEDVYIDHLNCIPNPFINMEFILNDKNKTPLEICTNATDTSIVNTMICRSKCPKSCHQVYYRPVLESDNYLIDNNTRIVVKNRRIKEFFYQAQPKLDFVIFIANIGGLFGLYLGISFVDFSIILKRVFYITRSYLVYILHIYIMKIRILKRLINFLKLLIKIISYLQIIKWKTIITMISIPVLLSQNYYLISDFFQYSTQISFEFIAYKEMDNKYSINEFPAITVCNEHLLDRYLFDETFASFKLTRYDISSWNKSHHGLVALTNQHVMSALIYFNFHKPNLVDFLIKYFYIHGYRTGNPHPNSSCSQEIVTSVPLQLLSLVTFFISLTILFTQSIVGVIAPCSQALSLF